MAKLLLTCRQMHEAVEGSQYPGRAVQAQRPARDRHTPIMRSNSCFTPARRDSDRRVRRPCLRCPEQPGCCRGMGRQRRHRFSPRKRRHARHRPAGPDRIEIGPAPSSETGRHADRCSGRRTNGPPVRARSRCCPDRPDQADARSCRQVPAQRYPPAFVPCPAQPSSRSDSRTRTGFPTSGCNPCAGRPLNSRTAASHPPSPPAE